MQLGIKILLVDDHLPRQRATSYVLEQEGYSVTASSTCSEARTLLVKEPDLLVIDSHVYARHGAQLARAWKQLRPASPMLLCGCVHAGRVDEFTRLVPGGHPIEKLLSAVAELVGL